MGKQFLDNKVEQMSAAHPPRSLARYPGFPKKSKCLVCDRLRWSTWPGDRIHAVCRKSKSRLVEEENVLCEATALREESDS